MSSSVGPVSSKTFVTNSQAGPGSARVGGVAPVPLRRRRTKLTNEKKIADDEFMAAAIGDVEWLRQSLREVGSQINFDKNGLSAIHLAAIHGRLECLKLCIEKFKQDVNFASSTGWRPIHLCISNQTGKRSLQCLSYLLEKGADPSITNEDGITPAHQAASEGHVQCLKLLIEVNAKIDAQDCRGNTPLDLAKLWGHRNCARILATELWHQDKNNVAKEMQQLKKVKMQQVLRELEEEEGFKAAQQFYGQHAYQQWLSTRGLEPKSTGPQATNEKGSPAKGNQSTMKTHESLFKPNSVKLNGQQGISSESMPTTLAVSIGKKQPASSKQGRQETTVRTVSDLDVANLGLYRENEPDKASENEEMTNKKVSDYYNPNSWNPSPKVAEKEYLPILKDEYPRDEYTMMPISSNAHKFFDGKFVNDKEPEEKEKSELLRKKLRKPKLPKEVILQVMSNDSTLHERPIVFKPTHISDIHKKKKYTQDKKMKSEAVLHLCNDLTSQLVQLNVLVPVESKTLSAIHRKEMSRQTSNSSSETTTSTLSGDNCYSYNLPTLLNTLKQMSKPGHFPSFQGDRAVIEQYHYM